VRGRDEELLLHIGEVDRIDPDACLPCGDLVWRLSRPCEWDRVRATAEEAVRRLGDVAARRLGDMAARPFRVVDRPGRGACLASCLSSLRPWRPGGGAVSLVDRRHTSLCDRGHTTDELCMRRGLKVWVDPKLRAGLKLRLFAQSGLCSRLNEGESASRKSVIELHKSMDSSNTLSFCLSQLGFDKHTNLSKTMSLIWKCVIRIAFYNLVAQPSLSKHPLGG